jgi:hypothetical protein
MAAHTEMVWALMAMRMSSRNKCSRQTYERKQLEYSRVVFVSLITIIPPP